MDEGINGRECFVPWVVLEGLGQQPVIEQSRIGRLSSWK